jgi:signal transduction histidine kinase
VEHLRDLAHNSLFVKPDEASVMTGEISGVRLIRIFRQKGGDLTISPGLSNGRLPEIEMENRKRPLNGDTAIIIGTGLLERPLAWDGTWLSTSDPDLKVHCYQPEPGVLAVLLIDITQVRDSASRHLVDWLATPLTPQREAGERVRIESPHGAVLVSTGPERHGPAASIIPTRTLSGDWQIRAWDGLVVTHAHDPSTLAVAAILSVALLASGVVLFSQQKRALKLASERVSFVNRVSHELGTPLTNLALNLDLATEVLTARPAEARRRLGLVAEEIERLSRLVANVLTFSRRERDTLELKPARCAPGEIIRRTLESFRPALERRGIRIEAEIEADDPVLLDPDALSQITGNLLSNVEKYAAAGGWLGLEAGQEGNWLILEVRDHGPGIPAAFRQRIFTPFERVLQTTNEGASGTGLGLAIGRDLALRMGGTLELVESPQGAVFRLKIPAPPVLSIVTDTDAA